MRIPHILSALLILPIAAGACFYGCHPAAPVPENGGPGTRPIRSARHAPALDAPSVAQLEAEVQGLRKALEGIARRGPYIVIDTVRNRLQIRSGDRVIRNAVCATGSGKVLLGTGDEEWRFVTPRGAFAVQRKVRNPIWKKPKWAFVERGRPAPVLPWDFSRLDQVTLGGYALELGDGYEIHGTLYPGLLGRHITHGCIRLNDADLEAAYTLTQVGTRVYIY